jgi:S1-C subfamily serine protease
VRISTVQPNGWAALAGLASGDVIESIDGKGVKTAADVEAILTACRDTKPRQVVFFIRRGVATAFAEVEPRW